METFTKLFGSWLLFRYHCFDRIVISGYLMGLQRPGQVVYWLQQVLGIEAIKKEVLSSRTAVYVRWVEAYARNRGIPIEWAERDVRKEEHVPPYLRRIERQNRFGVYFIFQTMEQGWTFQPGARLVARQSGGPADFPILHRHRARHRPATRRLSCRQRHHSHWLRRHHPRGRRRDRRRRLERDQQQDGQGHRQRPMI